MITLYDGKLGIIQYSRNLLKITPKKLDAKENKEFVEFCSCLINFYKKNDDILQIYDMSHLEYSVATIADDMKFIKKFTRVLDNYEHLIESSICRTSFIVQNPAIRGLVNTGLTFYKNKKPIKLFKSEKLCLDWFVENNTPL